MLRGAAIIEQYRTDMPSEPAPVGDGPRPRLLNGLAKAATGGVEWLTSPLDHERDVPASPYLQHVLVLRRFRARELMDEQPEELGRGVAEVGADRYQPVLAPPPPVDRDRRVDDHNKVSAGRGVIRYLADSVTGGRDALCCSAAADHN